MEIRHLRLIKAIVEEGSITKAIAKLHLTQSALSYQLKEAEFQLGTQIFHRINKKLVLTKAGEKIYATANEILHKLADTEADIRKMVFGESGEIRISTECYSSYHWLPSLMKQFHLLYPNVELKIVLEATHNPLEKLLTGNLDIAIVSDVTRNENIEYHELFQDEMLALVNTAHPWTEKKYVVAEDFAHENLIIHSLPMSSVTVHEFMLKPAGITPKKVTVMPMTEASVEMVKAEMGVMIMAQWAMKPYLYNNGDQLKSIKIGKSGLKRTHFIATLQDKDRASYFKHFIEFLQREIKLTWSI